MTPWAAAPGVLAALAEQRPRLVLVSGPESSPLAPAVAVRRRVAVAGATARLDVARGLALGGHPVVVDVRDVDEEPLVRALAPGPRALGRVMVVATSAASARAGLHARLPVLTAVWADDVAPLIALAAAGARARLVRLPDLPAARLGHAPARGAPRVLRDGDAGLVVGTGPGAPAAEQLARMLAARGVPVRAVDLCVLRSVDGFDPTALEDAVAVGDAAALRALDRGEPVGRRLQRVGVPDGDVRAALDSALAVLAEAGPPLESDRTTP